MRRPRHKFNARRTEALGHEYASKAEARYAVGLEARKRAGEIVGWIEQVPFRLPGGLKYVLDFLVFEADGSCRFVEVKGVETRPWLMKMQLMREAYPWVEVEIVK